MRELPTWKMMFCVLAVMTALASLRADDPQPPQSTPAQLALLDKITGIGSLKFGTELETFEKDSLKSIDNPDARPSSTARYKYTPGDTLTWGTLTPTEVELEFYYGQLVGIKMRFNETNGAFIPVYHAVMEKYGNTHYGGSVQLSDYSANNGQGWNTPDIYLAVCLPDSIPAQAPDDFLERKVDGAVELDDNGLRDKLTHQKQDALRSQLLKDQNLDKIKADL